MILEKIYLFDKDGAATENPEGAVSAVVRVTDENGNLVQEHHLARPGNLPIVAVDTEGDDE